MDVRLDMNTVFESKRDAWIVALIWVGALMCVFAASEQFDSAASLALRATMLILFGAAAAFMLWVLYAIDYTVTSEHLLIRCGPLRYRLPLAQIDSVQPSRNPLSSPAASLDRLLIKWNNERKRILISPLEKGEFLRELDRRCAQLKLEGEGLVRASAR